MFIHFDVTRTLYGRLTLKAGHSRRTALMFWLPVLVAAFTPPMRPLATKPIQSAEVDWREMGLVQSVLVKGLKLNAGPQQTPVKWVMPLKDREEDIDWREMGMTSGLRLAGRAKASRPRRIYSVPPVEVQRVPKRLKLPDLGEAVDQFTSKTVKRKDATPMRAIRVDLP